MSSNRSALIVARVLSARWLWIPIRPTERSILKWTVLGVLALFAPDYPDSCRRAKRSRGVTRAGPTIPFAEILPRTDNPTTGHSSVRQSFNRHQKAGGGR